MYVYVYIYIYIQCIGLSTLDGSPDVSRGFPSVEFAFESMSPSPTCFYARMRYCTQH